MPVKLICSYCGEQYEVIPSRSEESSYCSMECKSEAQSEKFEGKNNPCWKGGHLVNVNCSVCGSEVERRKDKLGEVVFCSKECESSWKESNWSKEGHPNWKGGSIKKICDYCNNRFEVRISRSESARFCSYQCLGDYRSENWSGEDSPHYDGGAVQHYGPKWQKIRSTVRERDKVCQNCGMSMQEHRDKHGRSLEVHHIKPISTFSNKEEANKLSNLILLCKSCHNEVEKEA